MTELGWPECLLLALLRHADRQTKRPVFIQQERLALVAEMPQNDLMQIYSTRVNLATPYSAAAVSETGSPSTRV